MSKTSPVAPTARSTWAATRTSKGPLKVAVVIPTYNERGNVTELSRRIGALGPMPGTLEGMVFVDDGSPDGTEEEIREVMRRSPGVELLERGGKKGLGTAYMEGFRYALDTFDPDVVIQIDADLQHPPEKITELVGAIAAGADVAIASRRVEGGSFKGLNWWRKLVSSGAGWLSRTILELKVKDTTTGFRALTSGAVQILLQHPPQSMGFIYQVESLYILKKHGFKMVEVPFVFEERVNGASKMGPGEMWEFFRSIVSMRFRKY